MSLSLLFPENQLQLVILMQAIKAIAMYMIWSLHHVHILGFVLDADCLDMVSLFLKSVAYYSPVFTVYLHARSASVTHIPCRKNQPTVFFFIYLYRAFFNYGIIEFCKPNRLGYAAAILAETPLNKFIFVSGLQFKNILLLSMSISLSSR